MGLANLESARGQRRHQRSWREADLVFSGPGDTSLVRSQFRGQTLQAPASLRDLWRRARCGCASASLGVRAELARTTLGLDEIRFSPWTMQPWTVVSVVVDSRCVQSREDDVETFGLHPTQLSGTGVSCFTRDRPPAADRQTRMAPISFVLSIWSRLHTPRLVSPSSGDYRDPGNIGRCLGTSLSSRAAETRCCCRCRGFAVAALWQKGGCRRRRTSRQSCTGSTPKRVVAARGRRWRTRRRGPSVLNEICQVVRVSRSRGAWHCLCSAETSSLAWQVRTKSGGGTHRGLGHRRATKATYTSQQRILKADNRERSLGCNQPRT